MKLSNSEKLFLKAHYYNWDDGLGGLKRILSHKDCDKATALLIYWRGHPEYYNQFRSPEDMASYEKETYEFLKKIEKGILENKFPEHISFTPDKKEIPGVLGKIPAELTYPSKGKVTGQDIIEYEVGELQLIKACKEGDLEKVKLLIEKGADINLKNGDDNTLNCAVESDNIELVKYLIKAGVNIKAKTGGSDFSVLHWACQSKRLEMAAVLLKNGLNVNIKGGWGRTALHCAVHWQEEMWKSCGMEKVVNFLLENGASPLAKDEDGLTPADLAATSGNKAAGELLGNTKKINIPINDMRSKAGFILYLLLTITLASLAQRN